jgi:hypothetical protein
MRKILHTIYAFTVLAVLGALAGIFIASLAVIVTIGLVEKFVPDKFWTWILG